jgi:FtsZ-binding cell division protein ZapB
MDTTENRSLAQLIIENDALKARIASQERQIEALEERNAHLANDRDGWKFKAQVA